MDDENSIEQLRQRYRREAHVAIEEAKRRAKEEVEQNYALSVQSLEDEVRKWKTIAEAVSDNSEKDGKINLVRYVMEQVYYNFSASLSSVVSTGL
jgi:hypothetical protein